MAKEWTTWFLGCLFFLLGIVFLFSVVEDSKQIFPRGFEYWPEDFWYWLLSYLPWLLPICCLGASIFCLSFARKRGEWTALLANGISPWQCFTLITLIGLGIGWTSDWLMKSAGNQSLGLSGLPIKSLKMQIGSERLWYFQSFDPTTSIGKNLQLFCYGERGEDIMRIRAEKAVWNPEIGWTFHHGRLLGFHSSLGLPVIDQNITTLEWERYPKGNELGKLYSTKSPEINRTFVELKDLKINDDPIPYLWLQRRPKDMSISQINQMLTSFPNLQAEEMVPYRLRKAQLWWNGPACIVALLIGLGLGSSKGSCAPTKLAGISLLGALGFYLISTLCDSLGEQLFLSPVSSASLPYFLVTTITLLFLKFEK